MLKVLLPLILLFLGCNSTSPRNYTFSIDGIGHGFVAEYKEWTATHIILLDEYEHGMKDTYLLGEAPVYGLEICDHEHESGNWAYYYSEHTGNVTLILGIEYSMFWDVFVDKGVTKGDSGTPVLCKEHDAVIGLVSAVYKKTKQVGIISKVP